MNRDNVLAFFSLFRFLVADGPSLLVVGEKMEWPGFLLRGLGVSFPILGVSSLISDARGT